MPRVPFGVPHKKKGPKPFPGTKRKRCDLRVPPSDEIKRPTIHYPKKRKTQVLEWMLRHRFPEQRKSMDDHYHPVRSRSGEPPISYEELRNRKDVWDSGGIVYRAPTYQDAGKFWRITPGTIVSWWLKKDKYLPAVEIERLKARHPLTGRTYEPMPGIPAVMFPLAPPIGTLGSRSAPVQLDGEAGVNNRPGTTAAEQDVEADEENQLIEEEDEDDDDDEDVEDVEDEEDGLVDNANDTNVEGEEDEQVDSEDNEDLEDNNSERAALNEDVQNTEDVDDIENSEEFRDLQEDLEDALGEDDPDIVQQVP